MFIAKGLSKQSSTSALSMTLTLLSEFLAASQSDGKRHGLTGETSSGMKY